MRRLLAFAALALALPLLAPTVAPASTAQVKDGQLLFTGGEAERNVVQLSGTPLGSGVRFAISDRGAPSLRAGTGCVATSVNSARCDAASFKLLTGDDDDSVIFPGVRGRTPLGRIDTGPGDDGVATAGAAVDAAGGPGDDVLLSQPPVDAGGGKLIGGTGNDRLVGRAGAGRRGPSAEQQRLFGSDGNDVLDGGEQLFGGNGSDRLNGRGGGDRLRGEDGNDSLTGSSGRDRFSGGRGSDAIDSETGDSGGAAERVFCGSGRDRVSPNAADRIARDCNLVSSDAERIGALPGTAGARLAFRLHCKRSVGCRGTLRLRRPGRGAFARKRYRVRARASKTIRIPLSHVAVAALSRRHGLRTRVTTDAVGYTIVLKR